MPFNLQDLACTKIGLFVKNKQEKTREAHRLHIHLCKLATKLVWSVPHQYTWVQNNVYDQNYVLTECAVGYRIEHGESFFMTT